jgi:RNA polymerase sigma-70 factor (ECF subfamily)
MGTTTDIDAMGERLAMKSTRQDAAGFLARIDQHAGIVRKVAMSYSRSAADRHDLEQEIIAQLWKSFPAFDGQRPFSTWMYRVALNVAISVARSQRWRDPEPAALDQDPVDAIAGDADTAEREHGVRELRSFIAGLDELNRALILLYLDEHSHREIADILGISESNVATKINRVKQRLRERMNPEENARGTR